MTRDASSMTNEDVDSVRAFFSEGEVVEIAAVVGLFNYFNRFNDALGMEPTEPGEGLDT